MLHRFVHPRLAPPFRFALAITFALLLGGCASTLSTEVTSFHQLSDGLEGQRFVLAPSGEQQGSLEFDAYAELVRQALVRKGLVDAGGANGTSGTADLGVTIGYSISESGSSGVRSGTSGFAGFGAGTGGFSMGSVGIGIGFPIGTIGGGSSDSSVYHRTLQVEIDRLRGGNTNPASGAKPERAARIFEARAVSEGPSASLAPVMRAMVQAVFEEFPGPSGTARVVRVPVDGAL